MVEGFSVVSVLICDSTYWGVEVNKVWAVKTILGSVFPGSCGVLTALVFAI